MGMSIDEAKIQLSMKKFYMLGNKGREAVQVALDTMRKYQKIQEIVKNTDRNADTVRNALAFGDIAKVVEDGKID